MSEPRALMVDRFGKWQSEFIGAVVEDVTWTLNEPETFSVKINPLVNAGKTFKPIQHEIQIWDDNTLICWGVPWRYSGSFDEITIYCEGLSSYFRKRIVDRTSLLYTGIEQRTIAWNLITYAQSEAVQANRNLNIGAAVFVGTTHIRDRNYLRDDHAVILDLLNEFPTLSDGFDWAILYDATGQRLWTPFYPQRGTLRNNMKLEWRGDDSVRDMISFTIDVDGEGIANHLYVTGGSNGGVKKENNYADATAAITYGVMQGVISDGSQLDENWLLEKATNEVGLRKNPIYIPSITVPRFVRKLDGTVERDYLTGCSEGDTLPIVIDAGIIQYNATERLKSKRWNPATDEIELTFNEGA